MQHTLRKLITTSAVSAMAFSVLAQDTPRPNSDRPGDRVRTRMLNAGQYEQIQGVDKASNLIGMEVKNHQDEKIGNVKDFVVDVQSGRIVALIVSSGGFLGIGNELSAVPPTAFRFNKERDSLQLDATKEMLSKAPHFKADQWPDFGQPENADQIYRAYQVEPYFRNGVATNVDKTTRNEDKVTRTDDKKTRDLSDQKDESMTPFDQGNSKADVDATAKIRKEINASDNMSVSGKNVKIITRDGKVTLRGEVDSIEERRLIGEIANRIARSGNVDNQLEVKSTTTTTTMID